MAPKQRVQTEEQLHQKSLTDRINDKENRLGDKKRLEKMENDLSRVRSDLESLFTQVQAIPQLTTEIITPRGLLQPPSAHQLLAHGTQVIEFTCSIPTFQLSMESSPSTHTIPTSPPVDCRCGINHVDQSDCLEYGSFTLLLHNHAAFSQDPQTACLLPRDPTLLDLTLRPSGANPLTSLISSFLRKFSLSSVETLFGIYFLAYRLMRWRLYPDLGTIQDVPAWLRPVKEQDTVPHPVSIDYIPWPGLRAYLCTHQNMDHRHSVKVYLESLKLRWPLGCTLLVINDSGEASISPEFERVVFDLKNWDLGEPWATIFPALVPLVHLGA